MAARAASSRSAIGCDGSRRPLARGQVPILTAMCYVDGGRQQGALTVKGRAHHGWERQSVEGGTSDRVRTFCGQADQERRSRVTVRYRCGGQGGLASDGEPFGWFCEITADVVDNDNLSVTLQGQIPQGSAVRAWMSKYNHQISRPSYKDQMIFSVSGADAGKLQELAAAFTAIVKTPARYPVPLQIRLPEGSQCS